MATEIRLEYGLWNDRYGWHLRVTGTDQNLYFDTYADTKEAVLAKMQAWHAANAWLPVPLSCAVVNA